MSSDLSDRYLRRSHRVVRVSEGQAIENAVALKLIHDLIVKKLQKVGTLTTTAQLGRLLIEVSRALGNFYSDDIVKEVRKDFRTMIASENTWNVATLTEVSGAVITSLPDKTVFDSAIIKPYQGRTFPEWFRRTGVGEIAALNTALRTSFVEGESVDQAVQRIKPLTRLAESQVRTLTRSSLLHASAEARNDVFTLNDDVIDRKRWSSVLDIRTTPHICGVRDQKEYTIDNQPIEHTLPWESGPGRIHFNCRSVAIPVIEGIPITGDRPAINAGDNYDRGDKTTATGRVRKPTKANRDAGIFEVEQRTTRSRYETWLKSQPHDFVADALGSADKATALKTGGVSLSAITNQPLGIPLTIADI